jgi:hypothetical protein
MVAIVVGRLVVRCLFVVANVMCGGWLWLSDGVPDSRPVSRLFCANLIRSCFAAVSR